MIQPLASFVGIDVQVVRGLAYAAMDNDGRIVANGWLDSAQPASAAEHLAACFAGAVCGIDAPRMPLEAPRAFYWAGSGWRPRRPSDKGLGRHCEVVIAASGLARPQWTPLAEAAPQWMQLGFELFCALDRSGLRTEEVFPSAAYRQLDLDDDSEVRIPLSGFVRGPKDMLDAIVAAYVVKEFVQGRGCVVGGGDGLGTIVLPRRLAVDCAEALEVWPVA